LVSTARGSGFMVYGKQLEAEIPSLKNAFFSKTHFSYVIMNQMLFIT